MTDTEPRYVPDGLEFDEEDLSWRMTGGFTNKSLLDEAFYICGRRKYFKSPKESRLWHMVDRQLSKGVIRIEWVNSCMKWARDKNGGGCAINVEALGHLIVNKARMQDWLISHKTELRDTANYDLKDVYGDA